jgi:hypothetical protein
MLVCILTSGIEILPFPLRRGADILVFRSQSYMTQNYQSFDTKIPQKNVVKIRKVLKLETTMNTRRKRVKSASEALQMHTTGIYTKYKIYQTV